MIASTRRPVLAARTASEAAVVVLPTPPGPHTRSTSRSARSRSTVSRPLSLIGAPGVVGEVCDEGLDLLGESGGDHRLVVSEIDLGQDSPGDPIPGDTE